jgi:hypothetical protein
MKVVQEPGSKSNYFTAVLSIANMPEGLKEKQPSSYFNK